MNELDILFEKMQNEIITGNKNNKDDENELKKKRKIIAKRIAATLVLIAGLSAIIIACKKNGDKKSADNIGKIQKGLVNEVKSIKPNEIKNKEDAEACEKKLDGIENITKKVKKNGYHEDKFKRFNEEDWSKLRSENEERAKRSHRELLRLKSEIEEDNKLYKQMGISGMQWLNPCIDDSIKKCEEIENYYNKLHEESVSENEISNLNMYIKDIYIIESVCKRYDDILTFESTMKLIDNICDKY